MTSTAAMTPKRIIFILLLWVMVAVAVLRWTVAWPARDDDDYSKWLLVSVFSSVLPWIIDLIMILGISLSLAKRSSTAKSWILSTWALCVVCPVLLYFLRIQSIVDRNWWRSIGSTLDRFAFPELFVLLLILSMALSTEATVKFLKELRERG